MDAIRNSAVQRLVRAGTALKFLMVSRSREVHMNADQVGPVVLEEDLLLLASDGDEAAIAELTKRGYTPNSW